MKYLFRSHLVLVAAAAWFLIGTYGYAVGQKAGSTKPFQDWSRDEVVKMLTDSPWSKTQSVRIKEQQPNRSVAGGPAGSIEVGGPGGALSAPTGTTRTNLGGAEQPVEYKFTIRLRSSLPVRQAIVRFVKIEAQYDLMTDAQKREFDAQTKSLMECPECADHYVVSVGFASANSSGTDLIYLWFRGQTIESLKGYIYLANEKGERRDVSRFVAPKVQGDEVFFLFPRNDKDGQPLLTPASKKLIFRMSDSSTNSPNNFELEVAPMIVEGRVEF